MTTQQLKTNLIPQNEWETIKSLKENYSVVIKLYCPTRHLSNLVDILLKTFLIHIKNYIKDNLDFLAKCFRENE